MNGASTSSVTRDNNQCATGVITDMDMEQTECEPTTDGSKIKNTSPPVTMETTPPYNVQVNKSGIKNTRVTFASLFKNNRMANANYKLEFMDTGTGKLKIDVDEMDSKEKTYGICLLGYVISGKPPTAALFDLVKRWGNEIKFQTQENGWIVFTFPSNEAKDKVLQGGPYMVYGFHLFLKEMPDCFRFREEDMNSIPTWVQIHGLPPVCWNFKVLSKLASRVGNPIHMDMLTHERKRMKFARVLIEVENSKPRVTEMAVELPIGDVMIKFEDEQDFKVCTKCHRVGHISVNCIRNVVDDDTTQGPVETNFKLNTAKLTRSVSVIWRKGNSRGRSRFGRNHKHAPPRTNSLNVQTDNSVHTMEGNIEENNKGIEIQNEEESHENIPPIHDKSESKLDTIALDKLRRIRFSCMKVAHNFLLNNKGRIMVLWNPNKIRLDVIATTEQSMHVKIQCLLTDKVFCTSFVYGFNTIVQRRTLWDDMKTFGINCKLPWIILGDFNNVLFSNEKKSGVNIRNYDTKDFVDCVASLDLIDLKFTGCFYTWMSPKVCSKLDRVLVNSFWNVSKLEGVAEFIAPGCLSDHSLCIASILQQQKTTAKPFKFLNMWTLSDEFMHTVRRNWCFHGHGTAQYQIKQLFNGLKKPLQLINRKNFSNISVRAQAANKKLERLQMDMLASGMKDEHKETNRKNEMLLEAERLFIAQTVKINFMKQGDRCTKFFHDLIKRHKKKFSIMKLTNEEGATIIDAEEIARCFIDYYQGLLGCKVDRTNINIAAIRDGPCIQNDQWGSLIALVTTEEI
ncbi:uncharacterized protein [Primulina huaijiensis]|uniref:uncharacterized protein n=1 Tax=Primulina huaijiensis TaxID=1492673 RepID=UPI003CC74B71